MWLSPRCLLPTLRTPSPIRRTILRLFRAQQSLALHGLLHSIPFHSQNLWGHFNYDLSTMNHFFQTTALKIWFLILVFYTFTSQVNLSFHFYHFDFSESKFKWGEQRFSWMIFLFHQNRKFINSTFRLMVRNTKLHKTLLLICNFFYFAACIFSMSFWHLKT